MKMESRESGNQVLADNLLPSSREEQPATGAKSRAPVLVSGMSVASANGFSLVRAIHHACERFALNFGFPCSKG